MEGLHGCDPNAICDNTVGSYNCTCRPGLIGDGRNSCISTSKDVNHFVWRRCSRDKLEITAYDCTFDYYTIWVFLFFCLFHKSRKNYALLNNNHHFIARHWYCHTYLPKTNQDAFRFWSRNSRIKRNSRKNNSWEMATTFPYHVHVKSERIFLYKRRAAY